MAKMAPMTKMRMKFTQALPVLLFSPMFLSLLVDSPCGRLRPHPALARASPAGRGARRLVLPRRLPGRGGRLGSPRRRRRPGSTGRFRGGRSRGARGLSLIHIWWLPESDPENLFDVFEVNVNQLVPHEENGPLGFGTHYKSMPCKVYRAE